MLLTTNADVVLAPVNGRKEWPVQAAYRRSQDQHWSKSDQLDHCFYLCEQACHCLAVHCFPPGSDVLTVPYLYSHNLSLCCLYISLIFGPSCGWCWANIQPAGVFHCICQFLLGCMVSCLSPFNSCFTVLGNQALYVVHCTFTFIISSIQLSSIS